MLELAAPFIKSFSDKKLIFIELLFLSNTKPPGIIGLIDVVKESYVDHTQVELL